MTKSQRASAEITADSFQRGGAVVLLPGHRVSEAQLGHRTEEIHFTSVKSHTK